MSRGTTASVGAGGLLAIRKQNRWLCYENEDGRENRGFMRQWESEREHTVVKVVMDENWYEARVDIMQIGNISCTRLCINFAE